MFAGRMRHQIYNVAADPGPDADQAEVRAYSLLCDWRDSGKLFAFAKIRLAAASHVGSLEDRVPACADVLRCANDEFYRYRCIDRERGLAHVDVRELWLHLRPGQGRSLGRNRAGHRVGRHPRRLEMSRIAARPRKI
jgi:hypothetical protein